MEPTLRVGDICVIDTSATKVERDGIYVIDAKNRMVIRRVAYNPIKDAYVASADNKLYADVWDIHEDDLTFVGRIVYAGRRM